MRTVVVVKVGGSLLGWDELPAKLSGYLDRYNEDRVVLVCGGGELVEAIRGLDRAHSIGEEGSHALALAALDLTADVLARIVPGLERVVELDSIADCWSRGAIPVLAPARFLGDDDREPDALAHSWSVTSDSIAARLAARLGATTLVLLKSTPLPEPAERVEAARLGLVDPAFAEAAAGVARVLYVNLRADSIEARRLDRRPEPRHRRATGLGRIGEDHEF